MAIPLTQDEINQVDALDQRPLPPGDEWRFRGGHESARAARRGLLIEDVVAVLNARAIRLLASPVRDVQRQNPPVAGG
jgi:hypothetical protein